MGGYCMPFEATSKCNAFCPVNCGPDEMHCPGAEDHMGCKMPDSCIPSKNGDCPAFCPRHCNENEMMCPGGVDGNGCPMPDECMHVDPNMRCSSKMMCPTNVDLMKCIALVAWIMMDAQCQTHVYHLKLPMDAQQTALWYVERTK